MQQIDNSPEAVVAANKRKIRFERFSRLPDLIQLTLVMVYIFRVPLLGLAVIILTAITVSVFTN